MNFRLNDLVDVLGIEPFPENRNRAIKRLRTDATKVQFGGDLYYIHPDPRLGKQDLAEAASRGASALLVEEYDTKFPNIAQLVVPDIPRALGTITKKWRDQLNPLVIGITGSCGKTTLKELLEQLLRNHYGSGNVWATMEDYDGNRGLPMMVSLLTEKHKVAVFEVATTQPGDIAFLSSVIQPKVAVLTNIEPKNLETLETLEGVAREKAQLLEALPDDGIAILNRDSDYFELFCEVLSSKPKCQLFTFGVHIESNVRITKISKKIPLAVELVTTFPQNPKLRFETKLLGVHHARSVAAAAAVTLALGIKLDANHESSLVSVSPSSGKLLDLSPKVSLIDDTQSSTPVSVKSAIDLLINFPPKRIMVMDDMINLGPYAGYFHKEVGEYAREMGIDGIFAYGELANITVDAFGIGGLHFGSEEKLFESLVMILKRINQCTIVVKGSNHMDANAVVQKLQEYYKAGKLHKIKYDGFLLEY